MSTYSPSEYLKLTSVLRVEFEGDEIDMAGIAAVFAPLHKVLNDAAYALIHPYNPACAIRYYGMDGVPLWRDDYRLSPRLARAVLCDVRPGSLFCEFSVWVASIVSNPDCRSILQNLVANAIWAIGEALNKKVKTEAGQDAIRPASLREFDPRELRDLSDLVAQLEHSSRTKRIRIQEIRADGSSLSVDVKLKPRK
jgi:hypothetical protein